MRYFVLIPDGMADEKIEALGNLTPMAKANKPTMDALAKRSFVGTVSNVPEGMVPESDTANLAILSYDPKIYSKGRSPLEAVSMGIDMKEDETAYRCNVVTLSDEEEYAAEYEKMVKFLLTEFPGTPIFLLLSTHVKDPHRDERVVARNKAVAKIALAFGMKVIASTNHPAPFEGVEFTDKDTLLANADFVSLHCPLTEKTEGMVNADFLAKMKLSAMLINTSRGQVVNENDLAEALKNGTISAAGLDVLSHEPPKADNPLFGLKNCHITPHIAWAGYETRVRLMEICKENLKAFSLGKPINVVY